MATITTDKCYTLTLTEVEASVLLGATRHVSGNSGSIGRREMDAINRCLRSVGVLAIDPEAGSKIEWKLQSP